MLLTVFLIWLSIVCALAMFSIVYILRKQDKIVSFLIEYQGEERERKEAEEAHALTIATLL